MCVCVIDLFDVLFLRVFVHALTRLPPAPPQDIRAEWLKGPDNFFYRCKYNARHKQPITPLACPANSAQTKSFSKPSPRDAIRSPVKANASAGAASTERNGEHQNAEQSEGLGRSESDVGKLAGQKRPMEPVPPAQVQHQEGKNSKESVVTTTHAPQQDCQDCRAGAGEDNKQVVQLKDNKQAEQLKRPKVEPPVKHESASSKEEPMGSNKMPFKGDAKGEPRTASDSEKAQAGGAAVSGANTSAGKSLGQDGGDTIMKECKQDAGRVDGPHKGLEEAVKTCLSQVVLAVCSEVAKQREGRHGERS